MAAARYKCEFRSDQGVYWRVDIWDEDFSGSVTEFIAQGEGFAIDYQGQGNKRDGNIKASSCKVPVLIQDAAFETMLTDILTSDEGRFKIIIYKGSGSYTDSFSNVFWIGDVLNDLGDLQDTYYPYEYEITATDGLGKAQDIRVNDSSWITGGNDYQFPVVLAKCLAQIQSNVGSNGIYASNETFLRMTSIWYEPSMNGGTINTSVDPWDFTKINESAFYKIDNDGAKEYISVFEAIDKITKAWGARIYFSNGMWQVDQISALAATSVKTHYYKIDGTIISGGAGTAYLDKDYRKTEGTDVKRLAGQTYNYFIGLKQAMVDYAHDYSGQLLPIPFTTATTYNLGTFTFDATGTYTTQWHILDLWGFLTYTGASAQTYANGVSVLYKITFTCTNSSGDVYYAHLQSSTGPATGSATWSAANTPQYIYLTADVLGTNMQSNQWNFVVMMPPLTATITGEIAIRWEVVSMTDLITGGTLATAGWNIGFLNSNTSCSFLVIDSSGTINSGKIRYKVDHTDGSGNLINKAIHKFSEPIFGDAFVTSSDGGTSYLAVYNGSAWEKSNAWQVAGGSTMPFSQLLCWDFIRGQKNAVQKRMGAYFVPATKEFFFENSLVIGSDYYVFNGGTFSAGMDEWNGEWFLVSLDSANLSTSNSNLAITGWSNPNGNLGSGNTNSSNNSQRIDNRIDEDGFHGLSGLGML